jgi:hypothetical protein
LNGLRVCALPLEVPEPTLERWRFTPSRAALWSQRYGVDVDCFVALSEEHDHRMHVNSHDVRGWKRLADPLRLVDIDLAQAEEQTIERRLPLRIVDDGSLSALLVYFEADLGGGARLSLHPDATSRSNSWGNLLYVLARPLDVMAGQELAVGYRDDGRGSVLTLG